MKRRTILTFHFNCKNIHQIKQQGKQFNYLRGRVVSKTKNLPESVDEWRRTQASHESHGGVEIPQTESALAGVIDVIDVLGNEES